MKSSGDCTELSGDECVDEILAAVSNQVKLRLGSLALVGFLTRFVRGELTSSDLQRIADAFEFECVEYHSESAHLIAEVLFELATPEINGQTTFGQGREYIKKLIDQNKTSSV